jgi:hypothetical protein
MKTIKKAISLITAGLFILFSLRIIWVAIKLERNITTVLIFSVLLIGLAYGLFKQFRWALRSTAFVYLMVAIGLPFAILNPFAVGDYLAAGQEPPNVKESLLWIIPVEILLLAIVYILDPRKIKINNTEAQDEGLTPHSSRTPNGAA